MYTLLFKAVVFFWPFLKNILFRDRPVMEVLKQHRHMTALFIMLLVSFLSLLVVLTALQDAREQITQQNRVLDQLRKTPDESVEDILAHMPTCVPGSVYDKSGVVELINTMEY